jgi:hypothetical protein
VDGRHACCYRCVLAPTANAMVASVVEQIRGNGDPARVARGGASIWVDRVVQIVGGVVVLMEDWWTGGRGYRSSRWS